MYEIKDRVYASRTDGDRLMTLTGALDIIQDCSLLWLESEPSFRGFLADNQLEMFIVSRQVDIVRRPVYGERITVRTRIFDCRDFLGYRNTVLYGEDGLPCLLTWSLGAFVHRDTGKMAKLPPQEIARLTIDPKIDMEYRNKKIKVPDLPARRAESVAVRPRDIDLYRHMNNVKYIGVGLDLLPEDFAVRRLRVEYKKPAKLGDVLYPQIIAAPSGEWYILLLAADEQPFAIMEFSSAKAAPV